MPLVPLIKKERDLDVVFALDISDNTDESWPSGVCMTNTYERQYSKQGKGMAFPYVPDVNTFLNLGLTNKPTFLVVMQKFDGLGVYSTFSCIYPKHKTFIQW